MNRRQLLTNGLLALASSAIYRRSIAEPGGRGVLLMERVSPTSSNLFVALADGSGERQLLSSSVFDYHGSFGPNDKIIFTSERRGRGQADLYSADADGSNIEVLTAHSSVEDAGVYSPDGTQIAFVSTRDSHRTNIWLLNLKTGELRNLTGGPQAQGDPAKPDGFFRPAWSPDGQWLAFSSDRNTEWRGHSCAETKGPSCAAGSDAGWEHIQQTSICIIRPNGEAFRAIDGRPGYSAGSPKWSFDSKRVIFYELPIEQTWNARIAVLMADAVSQIVSLDVATGERVEHTSGPGLKLYPQFFASQEVGYQIRGGPNEGLHYTSGRAPVMKVVRSPAWSQDGTKVIYELTSRQPLAQDTPLYSWDPNYLYRSTDSFPRLSKHGRLVITEHSMNSSIAVMDPDGSNRRRVFDAAGKGRAFAPCWSPDGQWIAFGIGQWFENRATSEARIMLMRNDGSELKALTEGPQNAGFPSYDPGGHEIVYRVWDHAGAEGLRILNLRDRSVRVLTKGSDNLPDWSPDGKRIVFTRGLADGNFDIFTVRPDGSDIRRLTSSGANDAHGVWTREGRILWTSGAYGFKDEAALYDNNKQPYGQIWIMNADGSDKRALTDSPWEDGEPMYIPEKFFGHRRS